METQRLMAMDKGGGDFKKLPPGAHFAVCNMVVDVGMQPGFSGKLQHKIYIRWECPDERVEFQKKDSNVKVEGPATIGKWYTLSLADKANLRHDLENWRGQAFTAEELQGFNIFNVIGKACQLSVVHEPSADGKKTFANIKAVMGLSKEQRARAKDYKVETGPMIYSLETPDPHRFEVLPDWLKEKISSRVRLTGTSSQNEPNGHAEQRGESVPDDFDDPIPF